MKDVEGMDDAALVRIRDLTAVYAAHTGRYGFAVAVKSKAAALQEPIRAEISPPRGRHGTVEGANPGLF